MKTINKLWLGLGILAVVSPIGLYLPDKFKAGTAWGEWSTDTIKEMVGYVPTGFGKLSSAWRAVMPDYAFAGWNKMGSGHLSIAYILSAVLGMALCIGAVFFIGKLLAKKGS